MIRPMYLHRTPDSGLHRGVIILDFASQIWPWSLTVPGKVSDKSQRPSSFGLPRCVVAISSTKSWRHRKRFSLPARASKGSSACCLLKKIFCKLSISFNHKQASLANTGNKKKCLHLRGAVCPDLIQLITELLGAVIHGSKRPFFLHPNCPTVHTLFA